TPCAGRAWRPIVRGEAALGGRIDPGAPFRSFSPPPGRSPRSSCRTCSTSPCCGTATAPTADHPTHGPPTDRRALPVGGQAAASTLRPPSRARYGTSTGLPTTPPPPAAASMSSLPPSPDPCPSSTSPRPVSGARNTSGPALSTSPSSAVLAASSTSSSSVTTRATPRGPDNAIATALQLHIATQGHGHLDPCAEHPR